MSKLSLLLLSLGSAAALTLSLPLQPHLHPSSPSSSSVVPTFALHPPTPQRHPRPRPDPCPHPHLAQVKVTLQSGGTKHKATLAMLRETGAAPSAPSREAGGQGQAAAGLRGGDPTGVPEAKAGSDGPSVGENMHMHGEKGACCDMSCAKVPCGTRHLECLFCLHQEL